MITQNMVFLFSSLNKQSGSNAHRKYLCKLLALKFHQQSISTNPPYWRH